MKRSDTASSPGSRSKQGPGFPGAPNPRFRNPKGRPRAKSKLTRKCLAAAPAVRSQVWTKALRVLASRLGERHAWSRGSGWEKAPGRASSTSRHDLHLYQMTTFVFPFSCLLQPFIFPHLRKSFQVPETESFTFTFYVL